MNTTIKYFLIMVVWSTLTAYTIWLSYSLYVNVSRYDTVYLNEPKPYIRIPEIIIGAFCSLSSCYLIKTNKVYDEIKKLRRVSDERKNKK